MTEQATEDTPIRYYKFGPAAGNALSADAMLEFVTWVFEHRHQVFMAAMTHIMGIDDVEVKETRRAANGHRS